MAKKIAPIALQCISGIGVNGVLFYSLALSEGNDSGQVRPSHLQQKPLLFMHDRCWGFFFKKNNVLHPLNPASNTTGYYKVGIWSKYSYMLRFVLKHKIRISMIIKGIEVYSRSCTKCLVLTFRDLMQTKGRIRWSMDTNHDSYLSPPVSEPLCLFEQLFLENLNRRVLLYWCLTYWLFTWVAAAGNKILSQLGHWTDLWVFLCFEIEIEAYYMKKVN